jgi:hypothetical protein
LPGSGAGVQLNIPGFRFPAGVITVAVRWYLRYGLSYRDVEELLAERGGGPSTSMGRSSMCSSRRVATARRLAGSSTGR